MSWADALRAAHDAAPWEDWIERDPIAFVRRYREPRDQEIAGLVAAGLAYGRVGSIMPSVQRVLSVMGSSPSRYVAGFDASCCDDFAGFVHRFHTPQAISVMLAAARLALERHGSLGALFSAGHSLDAPDTREGLARFVDALRACTVEVCGEQADSPALYGWRHFLASPRDGSACKRLNLYLRWMVRTGVPDVGAWTGVLPRQLVIPVDVHVANVARQLGMSERKSACWRLAEHITAQLRTLDSADPVRFDFVMSHIGMDGGGHLRLAALS